jgi:hypothetical protein
MTLKNVRPFRDTPSWPERLLAALGYLILGLCLTFIPPELAQHLLNEGLMIGAILFWALIIHPKRGKYFVRYHLFQALLVYVGLILLAWLITALLQFFDSVPLFSTVSHTLSLLLFGPIQFPLQVTQSMPLQASSWMILILSVNLVSAFYALKAEYTRIPYITDTVSNRL